MITRFQSPTTTTQNDTPSEIVAYGWISHAMSNRLEGYLTLTAMSCLAAGTAIQWVRGPNQVLLGTLLLFLGACVAILPLLVRMLGQLQGDNTTFGDALVTIAVFASLSAGEYYTAALVPLIMEIGHRIEQRSISGYRAAIDGLRRLSAKAATRIVDGTMHIVDVSTLRVGDAVQILPGDVIPVDGVVREGATSVDESTITGESSPRDVAIGEPVFAGTLNLVGRIRIQVTRVGEDTSLGKIVDFLHHAAACKPTVVTIVEQYAGVFVPSVILFAAIVFLLTNDIQRVVTVFVVSCPCALVLSGPTAMIAALAVAANHGVLIKNARLLDACADANTVVFDKTGTITTANLIVCDVVCSATFDTQQVLHAAMICASGSRHPVSRAIENEYRQRMTMAANQRRCSNVVAVPSAAPLELDAIFAEIPGCGVHADVGPIRISLGKPAWIDSVSHERLTCPPHQGPIVSVAVDGLVAGHILLKEEIRPEAEATLAALRGLGIQRTILLTGDHDAAMQLIKTALSFDEGIAEALPADKLAFVQQQRSAGSRVIVVGDGINDAPALAASDVGFALGNRGTDIAAQSGDIVLLSNDLLQVPRVLRLAKATRATIIANVSIAMTFSVAMLMLGAFAVVSPLGGSLFHNVGTVLVIANSSRLLVKRHD